MHTASPIKLQWSAKKAQHALPVQDDDADTDDDDKDNESANMDSDPKTNADADSDSIPLQSPCPPSHMQHSQHIPSSTSSDKNHTPLSSVQSPLKLKLKPRPIQHQLQTMAKAPMLPQERTPLSSGAPEPLPTPPTDQPTSMRADSSRTEASTVCTVYLPHLH